MADDRQRLSHHLWEILDCNGVSECMRAAMVRRSLALEMTGTVEHILISNTIRFAFIIGSRCEGTTIPDLKSDMDVIVVHEDHKVVNNLLDAGDGLCLLPIRDSNTVPGYVKLQLVYNGTLWDNHNKPLDCVPHTNTQFDNAGRVVWIYPIKDGNYLLNQENITVERHGPAMTTQEDIPVDMVYALQCTSWHHLATEWLERKREHKWPPSNMIAKAKTICCLFVHVGHLDSCEPALEWRLSLSFQERQLMFYLNEVQHKCYVLLKLLKSDIFEADSITSYHLKTCLFYCIERTRADFWQRDNLVRCLIYCLGTLMHWLRHGYCPNYFIKEQNLFRGKLNRQVRERSVRLLDEILLSGNCKFLFKLKRNDIGKQLDAYFCVQNIDTEDIKVQNTEDIKLRNVQHQSFGCFDTLLGCHKVATNLLSHSLTSRSIDITVFIQFHNMLLDKLCKIKAVSQHSEALPALQYIASFIHTSLACHLVIQVLQTNGSGMNNESNTLIKKHFSEGLQSDPLSSRLKHSAICYRLADYEYAKCILAIAENDCRLFVVNLCSCAGNTCIYSTPVYTRTTNDASCDMQHVSTDTWDRHVCCCVQFLPTEIDITPPPLQYEMFRSVGTRPPSPDEQMKMKDRNGVAKVDAIVFLHCMRYLVYSKKDDNSQKDNALEQLNSVITTYIDEINHKETSWNILGWIYRQEYDTSNAMECFKKSMALEPLHNAAKWQIAELCFEQLPNTGRLDTGN